MTPQIKKNGLRLLFICLFCLPTSCLFSQEPTNQLTPPQENPFPEKSRDEIFEKMFGKKSSYDIPKELEVTFVINQLYKGKVILFSTGETTSNIHFDPYPLESKLKEVLISSVYENLMSKKNKETFHLSLEDFEKLGITTHFNPQKLSLEIDIPIPLRKEVFHNMRRYQDKTSSDLVYPDPFSAYANFYYTQDYLIHDSRQPSESSLLGAQLAMENSFYYKGWVLENDVRFEEDGDSGLQRERTTITRPLVDKMATFKTGDIGTPTVGFQNAVSLGGLSYYTDFSLDPDYVIEPSGSKSFTLARPSTVEVVVNGMVVQKLELQAGTHTLNDIPLDQGSNDVVLRIKDSFGRTEEIPFSFIHDARLLKPGLSRFGYATGFPTEPDSSGRSYDTGNITASAFHEYGVNDSLTVGAFGQTDRSVGCLGFETLHAYPVGRFNTAVSMSDTWGEDYGFASRVGIRPYQTPPPREKQTYISDWGNEVEYKTSSYASIGSTSSSLPPSWKFSTFLSSVFPYQIRGFYSASYSVSRDASDIWSLNTTFGKSWKDGWSCNLSTTYSFSASGEHDSVAGIDVRWAFTQKGQNFSLSSTTRPSSRMSWQYSQGRPVDNWSTQIDTSSSSSSNDYTAKVEYLGRRMKVNLLQTGSDYIDSSGGMSKTSWGAETGIAYVGGHFAVTRPIYNSFAMIAPKGNFKDIEIGANPSRDVFLASSDRFGPGVLQVQEYRVNKVQLTPMNLPLGYDIGQTSYKLYPAYKSGFLISAGTEASVILDGIFIGSDGIPLSARAGFVYSLDEPEDPPILVFTNRKGKFRAFGFKPGKYEFRLKSGNTAPLNFEIPEDASGIYNIGELHLVEKQ